MSRRCNKCGQAAPYLSATWCLGCNVVEALTGELRLAWGLGGSRAVATDILVSATRQVRALRRLGIAGGGRARPASPVGAGSRAPPGDAEPPAEAPPPAPEPPATPAREVVKREEDDSSEYTDDSGEESEEKVTKEPTPAPGLTTAPKAKSDRRESLPRRRVPEADPGPAPPADKSREEGDSS